MRLHAVKLCWALGTLALLPALASSGGEVRIAFLQDTNSLDDTLRFLTKSGCTQEGIKVFTHAVRQYYKVPFTVDLSKFPKPVNGFYWFVSPEALVAAWPISHVQTNCSIVFNCADAVIALADRRLRTTLQPEANIGPVMISVWDTNRNREAVAMATSATAREAYNLTRPSWYQETRDSLFPPSMRDSHICLSPLLLQWHTLPQSVSEDVLESKVMEVLRTTWQRQALTYPSQFEVVLLHTADVSDHSICTRHAGLLFQNNKGCTYIEKEGALGPFVRLDLAERADLMPWFSLLTSLLTANCTNTYCHHFATFNDWAIMKISRQ